MPLGDETITHDADRHERRTRVGAIAHCPRCNSEIELTQETEAWVMDDPVKGQWRHSEYGPCQGVCELCELLIVDSFDGCKVYDLGRKS